MDARAVIAVLTGPACRLEAALEPDSALMSGLLDSLALFNLALWIEEQVGRPLDLAELDLAEAWATPAAIARFIEDRRGRA